MKSKQIRINLFLLFILLSCYNNMFSQCPSTIPYGSGSANNSGVPQQLQPCMYAREYFPFNNVVAGNTYSFTSTGGNGNYLTIRMNDGLGVVIAHGLSPLTGVVSPISGTLAIVIHSNSSCGEESTCRVLVANCTSCEVVQPPASPTGLTATSNSSTQISINWTAVADATSYQIDQATNSSFTSGLNSFTSASNSYISTGLFASTTYFYRVRAVNGGGASANSATTSATTQSGITIPSVPTGVAATASSTSQISLNWSAVAGATNYQIDQATNSSFTTGLLQNIIATSNSYSATGLLASTAYYYRVRALNAAGSSGNSSIASATTQSPPSGGGTGNWVSSGTSSYHLATVHIGKSNTVTGIDPGYSLFVAGGIKTEKYKLEVASTGGWADYVFNKDYKLLPLNKLKSFIDKNKHLPNFPSTKSILNEGGYEMGDMIKRQQEAIEHLHLYIIQLEDRLSKLEAKQKEK